MNKFKVGDRVRLTDTGHIHHATTFPDTAIVKELNGSDGVGAICAWDNEEDYFRTEYLELITNKGGAPMARRTFKLLKETPTVRAGAMFQLDDRDEYALLDTSFDKDKTANGGGISKLSDRDIVEKQSNWFVEVFPVTPQYMTQVELDQWKAFQAQTKTTKKLGRPAKIKVEASAHSPVTWTPARRRAHSRRLKAYWAAKKAA